MYKKLIAASAISIGLATSAFAQSYPSTGPTNSGSSSPTTTPMSSDYNSDNSGASPYAAPSVDPNYTYSTPKAMDCPNMPVRGSGVDTRGGQSGASISDACREYDN